MLKAFDIVIKPVKGDFHANSLQIMKGTHLLGHWHLVCPYWIKKDLRWKALPIPMIYYNEHQKYEKG